MGSNTLNARSSGQTILDTFFNDFNTALGGDFIGRNTSGVPTSGQNLGTAGVPWGNIRATSLVLNGSAVDTSQIVSPTNRVISGKMRSTSNQPAFLTPNGAAASFILAAATTNLLVDINGTPITIATNITKSSLTLAPSSNNTCLVDDSTAADQADTKLWGEPEHWKSITVDAMGSGITSKVGTYCAFKIAGVADEYFIAFVKSVTELTNCRRGYFYDSALGPVNRTGFSNNDVITIMSLGWVFVDDDTTTIDVTYVNPSWSAVAPVSPGTGDYWYDMPNSTWKRYDGASWEIIGRTYIGQVIIDSTNCVGAKCQDFSANYTDFNTLDLEISSTAIVIATKQGAKVNVAGQIIDFNFSRPNWNMTTHLASAADMYDATEQASRLYYLYLKDTGAVVISDISPYYRGDLYGQYHPHNPWRCIGTAYNDGSSNILQAGGFSINNSRLRFYGDETVGAVNTTVQRFTSYAGVAADLIAAQSSNDGDSMTVTRPGVYAMYINSSDNVANITHQIVLNSVVGFGFADSGLVANYDSPVTSRTISTSNPRYLKIGTIIRMIVNGATAANLMFEANRISD